MRGPLAPLTTLLGAMALFALVPTPRAATPLPPGHYAGTATATWTVTSSPEWLGGLALKALAKSEDVSEFPSQGSCTGVVGFDVPGDGSPVTGAARCEFAGDLAKYNDRVASLVAQEVSDGLTGTATCCGAPMEVEWAARRLGDELLKGAAAGVTSVTPVAVETPAGPVEVKLQVNWTVRFTAERVD